VGAVVADLDPAVAERIAKRLRIVEGFPFGEDPIAGVAECLVRWCKGSPTDPGWTPEDQADTLVSNAIDAFAIGDEGFEAWTGIKQLRRVFNDSFDGGSVGNTGKPVEHQVWTSRREPLCKGCNDTGFTIEDGKDGNTYARPCANCRGKVGRASSGVLQGVRREGDRYCRGQARALPGVFNAGETRLRAR
jgi:hypothetical protein